MNDPVHHRIPTKFPLNRPVCVWKPHPGNSLCSIVWPKDSGSTRELRDGGATSPVPNPHQQRDLAATTRTKDLSCLSPRFFHPHLHLPHQEGRFRRSPVCAFTRRTSCALSSSFPPHRPPHSPGPAELHRFWTKAPQQNSPGFAFQCV